MLKNVLVLAEATEGTTSDLITSALKTVTDVATTMIDFMMKNPLLSVVFVGGLLVPVGFSIFRKAKSAAR